MKTTPYYKIRDDLRTFDLVLWWGKGRLSKIIQWKTGGPSHVAMVIRDDAAVPNALGDAVLIWESTLHEDVSGVMLSPMSTSVKGYDGEFAVRRVTMPDDLRRSAEDKLPSVRKLLEGRPFEKSWLEFIKADYDGPFGRNTRDISSLFCSECIAETWQQCGLMSNSIASNEYTPNDFMEASIEGQVYSTATKGIAFGPVVKLTAEEPPTLKSKRKKPIKVNVRLFV